MKKVDVITMGCSKNLVDSERLLRRLSDGNIDRKSTRLNSSH